MLRDSKKILDRHVFQTRPVKQLVLCMVSAGYIMTDRLRAMLQEHVNGCFATQLVEDINGIQKNTSHITPSRRYRKESTLFAHTLHSNVVEERHHYKSPTEGAPSLLRSAKLPKDAFKPSASSSIDFDDLATTQSKATWWSPGPANASANIADLFMLRDLEKTNRLGELPRAWLGERVDVKHKLVICYCNDPLPGQTTYHALYSWPTSGVFLWPLTVRPIDGTNYKVVEHDGGQELPAIRSVTSLAVGRHVAYTFTWRSWLWQCRYCAAWARSQPPAVRLFLDMDVGECTLMELSCLNAFWQLPRTSIPSTPGISTLMSSTQPACSMSCGPC